MPEPRNLDDVIPEDIEYSFRGQTLTLPGDIPTRKTYALLRLMHKADTALAAAEGGADNLDEREQVDIEIEDALLELFRERDPKLKQLPFGVIALRHVLVDVLIALGFEFVPDGDSRPPARTASVKSKRSNSSRRSSRSSGSATTKS